MIYAKEMKRREILNGMILPIYIRELEGEGIEKKRKEESGNAKRGFKNIEMIYKRQLL